MKTTQTILQYSPHAPSLKQAEFLALDCEEALYGGAAGGGKSDALLMDCLKYVDHPRYAAILLRKSYADLSLPGAIMDRSLSWWRGTAAHWNSQEKKWTFPSGATISFGYLQTEADKYRYQSSEFQYIGWDELTQFSETQYTYLFSRLRRPERSAIPLRMRSASNPGGLGHDWVKARFLTSGESNGRIFIPARLDDNPGLDKDAYRKSLDKLDPITRKQLLDGDWDAIPGGMYFKETWFKFLDVPPAGIRWMRYWDLASTLAEEGKDPDWTAGVKMGIKRHPDGTSDIFIVDARRIRETPAGVERFIRATSELDGKLVPVRIEEEGGSSGKNTIHNYTSRVLFGWNVAGHRKTGAKEEMWSPLSSQAEAGNVYLLRADWNEWFVKELCAAPNSSHDDSLDAAAGAFALLLNDSGAGRTRMLVGT